MEVQVFMLLYLFIHSMRKWNFTLLPAVGDSNDLLSKTFLVFHNSVPLLRARVTSSHKLQGTGGTTKGCEKQKQCLHTSHFTLTADCRRLSASFGTISIRYQVHLFIYRTNHRNQTIDQLSSCKGVKQTTLTRKKRHSSTNLVAHLEPYSQ